jgi:hypothetical protein
LMIPLNSSMPKVVDECLVRDQEQHRAEDKSPRELSDQREECSEYESSQNGRPIGRKPLYHSVPPIRRPATPPPLSVGSGLSTPDIGSHADHATETDSRVPTPRSPHRRASQATSLQVRRRGPCKSRDGAP